MAAQVIGANDARVMIRHVIPQIIPLTMIGIAISIGGQSPSRWMSSVP